MPNNKWDDDSIESLLKDFPEIHDNRPKEEVYERLTKKVPSQRQPNRWLPFLVAALAFITVGALVASLISQNGRDAAYQQDSTANDAAETAMTAEGESAEDLVDEPASEAEEAAEFSDTQNDEAMRTAVYEEDLEDSVLFTIGLTENAFAIPVSFLIPDEQVNKDFGEEKPSPVDLYNQYADEIDERALGFDEYHPYLGTLKKTADGVEHILPADHRYDIASAAIGVYKATIQETFQGIGEVAVLNENGTRAEFSQVGLMEPIETGVKNAAYYVYETAAGDTFLVPGYGMPYDSVSEAIKALAVSPNDFLQATVPEQIAFSVTETGQMVQVEFETPFDFESLDERDAIRMIESFSLTAKSFGKRVQFINTATGQWNGFDFTKPIVSPSAPNRLNWEAW